MARVTKAQQQERAEWLADLRETLADVEIIYTVLTHVASSGMMRAVQPVIATAPNEIIDLTYRWAKVSGDKVHQKRGGIIMGGCGMDMGFALVYSIGRAVIGGQPWQCRGDRCPSNDHVNAPRVERGPDVTHTGDGGYRFRHVWL